jgi:fermentation-respiration switch protein FrsA (DUF1100 family)
VLLRRLVVVLLALLLCGAALCWYVGGELMAPQLRAVGPPPAELGAQAVSFPSESGSIIHGWYVAGETGKGAVLLLHGVRANRTDMVSRAVFLHVLGYSVLLIDFQAHGESPGKHITFGELESRDALAAIDFLRRSAPRERIGVIGVSLGAAAIVLANKPLGAQAVVLESMYPSIEEAVADRLKLHLGSWGTLGAPLLLAQMKPRLGIGPERLRPIDRIAGIGAPVLLIHGARDQHTTLDEARRVFAAAADPKMFWELQGAAHVNLHRFARQEYERRVSEWFARYLGAAPE